MKMYLGLLDNSVLFFLRGDPVKWTLKFLNKVRSYNPVYGGS